MLVRPFDMHDLRDFTAVVMSMCKAPMLTTRLLIWFDYFERAGAPYAGFGAQREVR